VKKPEKSYHLNQSPLWLMPSRKKLAGFLGFSPAALQRLADRTDNYVKFTIKQGDKERHIQAPKASLEKVHRKLFTCLVRIEKPDYLHSGRKEHSYITNAAVHQGAVPLVKLDIKQFYPSIDGGRVYRFFLDGLGCSPDVAGLLRRLCTVDGHLPTGSCLSQLLAFFSAKPMFDELHRHAIAHELRDSCYVDDLTWSGKKATPNFLWGAKQIVHEHGFKYHKDFLYTADDKKVVTGVTISGSDLKVIPSRELEVWEALNALGGVNEADRMKAIDSLIGKVSAFSQIDARYLARVQALRQRRKTMKASLLAKVKTV
jgi:hypothetical protein